MMDYSQDEFSLDPDYNKIHLTLAKLRISYPSELARECCIDVTKVNRVLSYFVREGAVKTVTLNPDIVHHKLKPRLHFFWSKGIIGFREFQKRRWYECNDKLYWGNKDKMPVKVEEEQVS